jgi:hypothetical protein
MWQSSLGKKYRFSTWRLLFSQDSPVKPSSGSVEGDDRSYFCSELVACVYKHLGLLKPTVSAHQFLPRSFTADAPSHFVEGAGFGSEYLLDFDS